MSKKCFFKVFLLIILATFMHGCYTEDYKDNKTTSTDETVTYSNEKTSEAKPGWNYSDGGWYYYNSDGTFVRETWISIGDKSYYLKEDGSMAIGWYSVNGNEFFFRNDGESVRKKWIMHDDIYYNFGSDGLKEIYTDISGLYEFDYDIVTDEEWDIGDKWIVLREKAYFFTLDGSLCISEWIKINDISYYFGSDGVMYVETTNPEEYAPGTEQEELRLQEFADKEYNYTLKIPHVASGNWTDFIRIDKIEDHKVWGEYIYGFTGGETVYQGCEFNGVPIKGNAFIVTNGWSGEDRDTGVYPIAYTKIEIKFEKISDDIPVIKVTQLETIAGSEEILAKYYSTFYDPKKLGNENEWFPSFFIFYQNGESVEKTLEWIELNIKNAWVSSGV